MMDQVRNIAWDTLKTTTGIVAVNMAGIPQMVRNAVPNTDLKPMAYGADGLLYAGVSEGVDYLSGDNSTIVNGDWYGYIDNIAFMGVASAVVNETGMVKFAYDQLNNVSPLGRDMNLNLTEGLVISSARVVGDLIERSPQVPDQIKYLRHPTRLMM